MPTLKKKLPPDPSSGGISWAEYVRQLQQINEWSNRDLAERVGCHHTLPTKWKGGYANPSGAAQQALLRLGGLT